ncbi:MAG: F420-dependent NADPH reductase [Chloroflexi bacterium OLB13]|nr:MAG: F420-dependent NADPH reductase [Chloroflexi bacterium OLB13]
MVEFTTASEASFERIIMIESDSGIMVTVAVIGGTGKEGGGLAVRWALNGYRVLIGSRDAQRAAARCEEWNQELGGDYLTGMANPDAAAAADIVVVSVPFDAQPEIVESIKAQAAGKIVVDLTVPLKPPHVRTVFLPEGGAAALNTQRILGPTARVVGAFHNVSAGKLKDPSAEIDCDVLVCSDDADAKVDVIQLVEAAGMRGVDAGPLANVVAAEALTPVLLHINKAYGIKTAGIRITGLPS